MNLSAKQIPQYWLLVHKAWARHAYENEIRQDDTFEREKWRKALLEETTGETSLRLINRTTDFDAAMLELAIVAGDELWLGRCSAGDERRALYVLDRAAEAAGLSGGYVNGIAYQMGMPLARDDWTAEGIRKLIAAVNTHAKRRKGHV